MGGLVELRKQIPILLAQSVGGGAQITGDAAFIIRVPSFKIRWSWEIGLVQSNLLGLDNTSVWTLSPMAATNPPTGLAVAASGILPDSFEAQSSGRIFRVTCHLAPIKRNPAVAGSGTGTVLALVTFEPADPQMSDAERAMWLGACAATPDGPPVQIQAT